MTVSSSDRLDDGLFYPPHAPPLTGDENVFVSTWKFLRNPLEGFGPLAYRQPIVSLPTFGYKTHVICDPEGMQAVLAKDAAKFSKTAIDHRILGPATKEGLLSVHGEQWKRQRRGVAPMFRHRHMADLAPMITLALKEFAQKLQSEPEQELGGAMADLTFDVLSKGLLGDPKGLDKDRLKLATRKVVTTAGTLRPDDLLPLPRWVPRPIMPSGTRALKQLKRAADALIAARDPESPGEDLVGLLISARDPVSGAPLTVTERRDNLIGFFIAGHETTALTLTWALYLTAKHDPSRDRLRNEVRSVCGSHDVTYEDIEKLPFTRAVIDEAMRLYPPAPILNRQCREDTHILGRDIKAGDHLILNNYIMHRAERLWDNPHAFDPSRFLRDPALKAKGAPFMPFGAGPRICVGAAFAIMEAMMALATLVRDYDITVPEACFPRPLMTVTLRPEGGIPARFNRPKVAL